jgi:hypothetical protein
MFFDRMADLLDKLIPSNNLHLPYAPAPVLTGRADLLNQIRTELKRKPIVLYG